MTHFKKPATLILSVILVAACAPEPKIPTEIPLVVRDTVDVALRAAEVRENTPVSLADGLRLTLWASDSLAPDPIAMDIDDKGAVYLTRTNRQKNSEFDIRGHRDWMTPSISLTTVAERRAFLREVFAPEKSKENEWLKDLNGDGLHDWQDLAVEKDEIWKLEDEDGDGFADKSTRILSDFNEEITDVAGALLVRKDDIFLGIGPDMWRLKDINGDGVYENKTSISHGYNVHIGFGGHGMSGAIEGPDGKIYWGAGDIGANITAVDGSTYPYPNQGVIVRSNPDGSNFEVFAAGLRNTHEFVFDAYGNIITADNDGDHAGESERLVYIVDGLDAGWRTSWQFGKYTDPKNNGYNVWMDEAMYKPRWEGQAAYFIPPIMNFHNGPTGMTFNPGTALGSKWKNHFFLSEFVGTPVRSRVWAFTLKPSGASFELEQENVIISGILPTGLRFGPDGALYVADWINGWNTKNYGRVWKMDVSDDENDLSAQRQETARLMTLNFDKQSRDELYQLLFYDDMRIRQKAQFALAKEGKKALSVFKNAVAQKENQFARIHGIWGLGQLAAADLSVSENLIPLLADSDPEIIAQAAKVMGDVGYAKAGKSLIPLLSSDNSRVQFFTAQALGRIKEKNAIEGLLRLIEQNNDTDVYVRHAAVLALSRIGDPAPLVALAGHPNRALRIAAVLVLRRLGDAQIALFLKDEDEYIVAEAARAINDDLSIADALPQLAAVLNETRFTSEALMRRAINASLRVGGSKELDGLLSYTNNPEVSASLKAEALAALGTWSNPSVLDRVDGRNRGEIQRDAAPVILKVKEHMEGFLKESNPEVIVSIAKMVGELGISDYNEILDKKMAKSTYPEVRSAIVRTLSSLKYSNIASVIKRGMEDKDQGVRTTAIEFIGQLDISKEKLPSIVNPIFKNGTLREQQEVVRVLGEMPIEKTEAVLGGLIDQLARKKLSSALLLDVSEAVTASQSETLIAQLAPLKSNENTLDAFKETLFGGDRGSGRDYFRYNSTGQCMRCHSVGGDGGNVGPSLTNIGSMLSREQLLQALVEPSARLAPGYGTVSLTLTDGQNVTGILLEEHADELILKTAEAEPMEIPLGRIAKRTNLPSSMPAMGMLMSKRELRDVIEFLVNLK
ncbi:HEAT repeat domain-containing protein [Arenibacter sp. GZD96]|uniref:HEAT repeat domain-containing protein n=1 Tax=Aurantibrevibacter litoralis TaxID=3106030 RepID=UPI002AFE06D4|nr:HEAT repeat domain-containing protein [Arenibacter sp. GZD-96]MEA1785266.1 HEAT repeat domain-containing protein [Arenibacter sp. GZD-96]